MKSKWWAGVVCKRSLDSNGVSENLIVFLCVKSGVISDWCVFV